MVDSDHCAMLKDFAPLQSIHTGNEVVALHTGPMLGGLGARVMALPFKRQ